MQELTSEVVSTLRNMTPEKQRRVFTLFQEKLANTAVQPEGPAFLSSPCHTWILPEEDLQQVPQLRTPTQDQEWVALSAEQKVGPTPDITTIQDLCQISNAPPIMNAPNPRTKLNLKSTKRVHQRITRNNKPGTIPPITTTIPHHPIPTATTATLVQGSPRLGKTAQRIHNTRLPTSIPKVWFVPIGGRLQNHNIISQQAINFITDEVWNNSPQHFTPANF
jgi:hypothetical protein